MIQVILFFLSFFVGSLLIMMIPSAILLLGLSLIFPSVVTFTVGKFIGVSLTLTVIYLLFRTSNKK